MSSAAKSAVASAPLQCNVALLERRLLALRAEIDSILTELVGVRAAPEAIEPSDQPEQVEAATAMPAQAEAPLPPAMDTQASLEATAPAEILSDPNLADAIASEQPAPQAQMDELPSRETQAIEMRDDLTLIAASDADHADRSNGLDMAETLVAQPMVDTAAVPVQAEATGDVAVSPTALAASLEPTSAEPTLAAAAAPERADGIIASAGSKADVPAEAVVINLQPRHRKDKAAFAAAATAPARPRRKLATKIAACIVASLAAAAVLAVSDRTAVGSVPLPSWGSPLPSYVPSSASWSFLVPKPGASQSLGTDISREYPGIPAATDALLARYREVWPTGR